MRHGDLLPGGEDSFVGREADSSCDCELANVQEMYWFVPANFQIEHLKQILQKRNLVI